MRAVEHETFGVRRVVADGDIVVMEMACAAPESRCPTCGVFSHRVHDRYRRQAVDLPWRGATVRVRMLVRRFVCVARDCPCRTFAEDVSSVVGKRLRRTVGATQLLTMVAYAMGGEAGARMARALGVPISPDTLLRLLRAGDIAPLTTPRVLGVDDLSLRRRQTYATILVDLETNLVIDLLNGRDADTLAGWLTAHPGVEIIARDRSGAYADGGRRGAPDAVQVADRFHLVQNAGLALAEVLHGRRRHIDYADAPVVTSGESAGPNTPLAAPAILRELGPSEQIVANRRAARIARWERVHELRANGRSLRWIAHDLDLARQTVRRLAHTPLPPRDSPLRQPRPDGLTSPMLQPYVTYLQDRWQAGCHNISQLFREIAALGYPGGTSLLHQALLPWRPQRPPGGANDRPRERRSRYGVRGLCLRPRERLTTDEQSALNHLFTVEPTIAEAYRLAERFRALVADRNIAALDDWLTDAKASSHTAFVALANGIVRDRPAVDAALTMRWSTGPVEGQIHRVKLIKRQGYGRANLDLLRRRVRAA